MSDHSTPTMFSVVGWHPRKYGVSSLRCLWSKPSSTSPTMAFSSVRLMTMPVVSSTSPDTVTSRT